MRIWNRSVALIALLASLTSCAENTGLNPIAVHAPLTSMAVALPDVRISELHYDNTGTDADEAIEISGPAGTDLTGWQLVLYNGTGGLAYGTTTLSGPIPASASCSTRGVIVQTYPSNGIQNGSPDGIALVDATGTVVEFLSYEGTFAAVDGPAVGLTSVDIGATETGSEPLGQSLQRTGGDIWNAPATSTFGICNDHVTPPPVDVVSVEVTPALATIPIGTTLQFTATAFDAANQPIPGVVFAWSSLSPAATVSSTGLATGISFGIAQIVAMAPNGVTGMALAQIVAAPELPDVRFSELHYDNSGTDAGEAIEIEGPTGADLAGWSIALYNGNDGALYGTRPLSGTIPATCSPRGVVVVTYPQDGIQNGSPDGMALVNAAGTVVEFLSYEGTLTAIDGPAAGMTSTDIGVSELSTTPLGQSLQRDDGGIWRAPATAAFGACFGGTPPPPANTITFSGRTASDPALPVGFQDQIFATVRDAGGVVVVTPVTWSSDNALASVDQDGVVTALGAGTAVIRATAEDGVTTATFQLATRVATAATTAIYAGNTEFGDPVDGDAGNDFIVRHPQFTSSYNAARGTPNWVSYDLEATHFGAEDRCDCFTFDPALPALFTRYTTADYTGAGAFHGYGIDRGHLARSFDRTAGSLDNAFSFYFTNIIPQAADLNQGPWAAMENHLGDLARLQNREVYIIAGVAGSKGTLKDEGLIVIPTHTWKVAVILPRDQGLADFTTLESAEVIAAIMPNDPGVRSVDWNTYRTTVDAVEALSGYDLLALLPDQVEIAVESNTRPPVASVNGPFASSEGAAVAMSAAGSSDPDGQALTYAWDFGDGSTGSGISPTHTYVQDGAYTVTLTVTDVLGLFSTTSTTTTVANVAPVISDFGGATLLPGETYTSSGSFVDPGADSWSATVDYGTGSGAGVLALTGKSFTLSNTYASPGTFTVTVLIADDDATSTHAEVVTVLTLSQGVHSLIAILDQLVAAGKFDVSASGLRAQLVAAAGLMQGGSPGAAHVLLQVVKLELDKLVEKGAITAVDAAPLHSLLDRLLVSGQLSTARSALRRWLRD
jgi:DNA/RNA endonuclease G (NUC1)